KYSRSGLSTSESVAEPFGQRRPREIGLSGSPSICTIFSSLTKIFCPQPTAQNGQIDFTTLASTVLAFQSAVRCDWAAEPNASGSAPPAWRKTGQRARSFMLCEPCAFLPGIPPSQQRNERYAEEQYQRKEEHVSVRGRPHERPDAQS